MPAIYWGALGGTACMHDPKIHSKGTLPFELVFSESFLQNSFRKKLKTELLNWDFFPPCLPFASSVPDWASLKTPQFAYPGVFLPTACIRQSYCFFAPPSTTDLVFPGIMFFIAGWFAVLSPSLPSPFGAPWGMKTGKENRSFPQGKWPSSSASSSNPSPDCKAYWPFAKPRRKFYFYKQVL